MDGGNFAALTAEAYVGFVHGAQTARDKKRVQAHIEDLQARVEYLENLVAQERQLRADAEAEVASLAVDRLEDDVALHTANEQRAEAHRRLGIVRGYASEVADLINEHGSEELRTLHDALSEKTQARYE